MPLPNGLSTFSLSFGPYVDLMGNVSYAGMRGTLSVSPAIVDSTSGAQIFKSVSFVIGNDGTATVSPLVHNDDPRINQGTQYAVTWEALSYLPTPGNRTFVVPIASGSAVDYDLLTSTTGTATGTYALPLVTSVNGHAGAVTLSASDVGADAAGAASSVGTAVTTAAQSYTDGKIATEVTRADGKYVAAIGLDTAMTTVQGNASSAFAVAQRAAFVPFWAPAETVTAGTVRVDSTGHLITRNANGTTRSTYDATEEAAWTVVSGGGGGASLPTQTSNGGKFLTTDGTSPSWATVPAAYTDEQAQDAIAALFAAGTDVGITFVYDDAGNRIGATVSDATKTPLLTPTATKTAAYTAAVGDLAMMNVAGGGTALTLPTAPADKTQVGYRAIGATASVPLTVNRSGTDTIGTTGATSATVPLADETLVYQYDAPNTRWLAIANIKTKASLDASYGDAAVAGLVSTTTTATTQALRTTVGPGVLANGILGTNLVKVGQVLTTSSGSWDNDKVEGPSIGWDPQTGQWAMTYVGYNNTAGTLTAKVGLAFSPDLVNWTKYGSSPILAGTGVGGDPDQSGCSGPVWVLDNGVYHLFYIGLTASGYEAGTKKICHATSTSLTGTWTRQGTIITPAAAAWRNVAVWHPSFVKKGSTWYCFFNANGTNEQIGYATASSLNGPWTVDDVNSPILTVGSAGAFDLTIAGDPRVRGPYNGTWVMDYYGYNGTLDYSADGVATTTDANFPLGWTKYTGNPILTPTPGSLSFDNMYASKPMTLVVGGQVLHFYTAVASGNIRSIALAVTVPQGGTNVPYRNTAAPASNNPAMLLSGKSVSADGSNLVLGDLIKPATATGRVRFEIGNTTGNAEAFLGQGPSNNLILGWTYNATAANASGKVETWSTANTLNIQNTAGKLVLGGSAGTLGFLGSAGTTKQAVSGSRGANAALASLITILAGHGLLTDSTTA